MIEKKQQINNEQLKLIPKLEEYIQYMLEIILKIPRTEKFNIGNEYKNSMYSMLENVIYISKIKEEERSRRPSGLRRQHLKPTPWLTRTTWLRSDLYAKR